MDLALTLLALTPAAALGVAIGNWLRRTRGRDVAVELHPERRQTVRR